MLPAIRIELSLSPENAVARLERVLKSPDFTPYTHDVGSPPLYGAIRERHFTARRGAFPRGLLHGELKGQVEARESGSVLELRRVGADWLLLSLTLPSGLFVYSLTVAAGFGFTIETLFQGVGMVAGIGVGVFLVWAFVRDWRVVQGQIRVEFRESITS